MKYLIQHTFSIPNPWYLLPNFLSNTVGKTPINNKLRFGFGRQDEKLFDEGKFNGTELTGIITGVFNENWEFNKKRIAGYKKKHGKIEVFHACVASDTLRKRTKADWELNLWKDNEYTRNGIKASIYLAKELIQDIPIVNFHLGKYRGEEKTLVLESLKKNLRFAEELARQEKVIITLENDYQKDDEEIVLGANIKEFKKLMDEIGSPYIKVCFDWGHANTQARFLEERGKLNENELKTFEYHKRFIRTLGKHIAYAHLHYNKAHVKEDEPIRAPLYPSEHDKHMPLNSIRKEDLEDYLETLTLLKNETLITEYGKILLELTRKKMFRLTFNPVGATTEDALKSLEFVKQVFGKQ